jgi:hypothetical protein
MEPATRLWYIRITHNGAMIKQELRGRTTAQPTLCRCVGNNRDVKITGRFSVLSCRVAGRGQTNKQTNKQTDRRGSRIKAEEDCP